MIIRTPYPNYSLLGKLLVTNSKKKPEPNVGWECLSSLMLSNCQEGDEYSVYIEFLAKNESLRKDGKSVRVTSKVLANGAEIIPAGGCNITPEAHYELFTRQGIFKLSKQLKGYPDNNVYVPSANEINITLWVKAACTSAQKTDYIEFGDITSIQAVRIREGSVHE